MPEYLSPGLTIQEQPQIAQGRNAPIGMLASDASVNAAYQALMQAINNADLDKGTFQRQLTDNLARSQQDRKKALLMGNQSLADRGLLNSGAALQQQQDVGTQWDAYDQQLNDFYQGGIQGVDRGITALETGYGTAQLDASGRWTAEQAAAADSAIKHQQSIDAINAQTAQLMAMIAPQTGAQTTPDLSGYVPSASQGFATPAASNPIVRAAAPKPASKQPISGQTGYLKQTVKGGPQ